MWWRLWRSIVLGCALGLLAGGSSTTAQTVYSLSGNARFQAGNGLPVPITVTPAPVGAIVAVSGATVMQSAGSDPKRMTIAPAQLSQPASPYVLPVFLYNSNVFQAATSLSVRWPAASATFRAGGRFGPATVSFCPGDTVTPSFNPGCALPASATGIRGRLRYTKTANQFGGAARAAFTGLATVAMRVSAGAPCDFATTPSCLAGFVQAQASPRLMGGTFADTTVSPGIGPSPGGFPVRVTPQGLITHVEPTGVFPQFDHTLTSVAGPWTTGMVTVSYTNNVGAVEIFTLTGSDARVSGIGQISLVAGGIAHSSLNPERTRRGWLNLQIGELPAVPTMGERSLAVLAALLVLAFGWYRRRG